MYRRKSVKSDMPAEADKVEKDLGSFTVSLFPINEQNKDKLKQLYTSWRREREIIHRFSAYATLYIADLRSVCPSSLLDEGPNKTMPWLNDNAVNCRLAQIAAETQNMCTFCGTESGPKTKPFQGHMCKFLRMLKRFCSQELLGVFDVPLKQVRIYDSMKIYNSIENHDMDILREAFQKHGSLDSWTICNPEQWMQRDCVNCGVFVCTAAETEVKNMKMTSEVLQTCQLVHLRVYHATSMLKDVTAEDFPTAIEREESEIEANSCMAQDIKACVFQKTGNK